MFVRIPFSPIRESLYSPQELMAGLDAADFRSFPRTPISDVSRITCATVAPLREIPSPAFMKRCTTTPSRRPFSLSSRARRKWPPS